MRCPKCNFVSYDLSETCVKCGKNISSASKELQGTVASIAPPSFLRLGFAEAKPEAAHAGEAASEVAFDLGGEEEAIIDLGTEEPSLAAGPLDLGVEAAAAEPVDLGGPALEVGKEEPAFALPTEEPQAAGFEISDLAPPQEAAETLQEVVTEELEFAAAEAPQDKTAGAAGLGLADLKVEGIDLEAAPAKGKVMSPVKTGTALDEFDVDLGELIAKKK